MKRFLSIVVLALLCFSLLSCAPNRNYFTKTDLAQEPWHREMITNPKEWARGADRWFLSGGPTPSEVQARRAPFDAAITTSRVRISDRINRIEVDGGFQAQIFGTDEHNTLYIYGPNIGVRHVGVDMRGDKLEIFQTGPVPFEIMRQVIVRVGVRCLNHLTHRGMGTVEAIRIGSNDLSVVTTQTSSGNMYLGGRFNLKKVMHAGDGSINVFGARSPDLDIRTTGLGSLNITGNVGVRSIVHRGRGNINIVGANSNSLTIDAKGFGQIGISGIVNLKSVDATDMTRVFVAATNSRKLRVTVSKKARVGLAGCTKDLYVTTFDDARYEGRELCAQNAFLRAFNCSHMNVTAANKAFASAIDESSIYFYGPAHLVSSFIKDYAVIIPMEAPTWCNINSEFRSYSYTLSHGRDNIAYTYMPRERLAARKIVRRPPPSAYIK